MHSRRKQSNNHIFSQWWIWILLLLLITIIVGGIGIWYQMYYHRQWNGKDRLNLAVINSQDPQAAPIQIVSIETYQPSVNPNQIVTINLPPEVEFNVAYGYGPYMVSSLYGLSQQEKNINIVTKTLSYELGIPIDGYLVNKSSLDLPLSKMSFRWWQQNTDSNYSWADRLYLWLQVRKIKPAHIYSLDFQKANWAREEQEIDGQKIISFDKNTVDSRLPELVYNTRVRNDAYAIRISNTTGIFRLGQQISRIVTGMGGHVVEVNNNHDPIGQCTIQANTEAQHSYTVQKISKTFDCRLIEEPLIDQRVDIQVNTGFEQAYTWLGR